MIGDQYVHVLTIMIIEFLAAATAQTRPSKVGYAYGRSGRFPVGEINNSQTATIVVVK